MQYLILYAALYRWDKLPCHHENHKTPKKLIKRKAFTMLAISSWEEPAWRLLPQWSSLHFTANRKKWRKLIPPCQRKRCDPPAFLRQTEKSPCQHSLSVFSIEGRNARVDCLRIRAMAALWQHVKGVMALLIYAQARWQRQRALLASPFGRMMEMHHVKDVLPLSLTQSS